MVAAGVYELAKSMCVWFLNNTVTRSRRLLPGQPVPNEFTFVVLAVALQSALVVALLEGELLHYDMAVPGEELRWLVLCIARTNPQTWRCILDLSTEYMHAC